MLNATRMPTASATAPNMGPRMAPRTAAPNAVPSSSPRRSRGVATVSQASAPAHVVVLEMPWTNRASPSAQGPSASANAKLDAASRVSPATTAIFGPRRAAASPPGIPPSSAPGAEGSDEQPGAGLGEPELLRVAGHERREDAEQQRVDEQDHRHENEKPAHQPTLPMRARARRTVRQSSQNAGLEPSRLPMTKRRPLNQASRRPLSEPRSPTHAASGVLARKGIPSRGSLFRLRHK